MNVKFKMPKFGRKWTKKTWWKELLLTFLGTTISIVLTFGTTHWLDLKAKKAAGRQMAMMAIHDIDETLQFYKELGKKEKDNIEVVQYVVNNLDKVNSISDDTLEIVYDYLVRDRELIIDDSKEKIFHSSPETWKNIDNPLFIDVVQQFYFERRNYYENLNTDPIMRPPFSAEDNFNYAVDMPSIDLMMHLKRLVPKMLNDKRVKGFIDFSFARQHFYSSVVNEWQQKSDQCKFLMGITDEELKEYVEKRNRTGRSLKESELVGKWTSTSSSEEYMEETIEFKKDHSFVYILSKTHVHPAYSGQMVYTANVDGTWSLEGDSLIRNYNLGAYYTLDTSGITYAEEMKDSVQRYIKRTQEMLDKQNELYKVKPVFGGRTANVIFIDRSGNKVEMTKVGTDEEGNEVKKSEYMTRVRK